MKFRNLTYLLNLLNSIRFSLSPRSRLSPLFHTFFHTFFPTLLSILFLSSILQLQGCAAVAVSGAGAGLAMVKDRRTAGTIVEDQAIEMKSIQALVKEQELWKPSHISVHSYNNNILLVGQTPTHDLKQRVEDLILRIPKVRKVYNEISVGNIASIPTRSKDSLITAKIKTKMLGSKDISSARIKVITEDAVVYLMGLTTREEEITATEIARAVPEVEKVIQIFEHI